MTIEVTWRSGKRSVITGVKANHLYEVDEAGASERESLGGPRVENVWVDAVRSQTAGPSPDRPAPNPPSNAPTLFADFSSRLNHSHEETPFNDFERQPLLYKSFGRMGPGVAWVDLDGDGHDELVVGGSQGGHLAIFGNNGQGELKPWTTGPWSQPLAWDLTGLAVWMFEGRGPRALGAEERGRAVPAPGVALLAGQSNYRDASMLRPSLVRLARGPAPADSSGALEELESVRLPQSSAGPIAVADFDGDGDLDLFVGGRVVAGRFPEPASSAVYRNDQGTFKMDEANNLRKVGLVSGAVWSDLDGDGFPELVLACEWGPIKVFRNDHGRLSPWNPPVTGSAASAQNVSLDQILGWWNGVTTGDFDGDGRLDIIASNWGLNSSFHDPSPRQPLRLDFGDFDGNGSLDLLETETDPLDGRVVPRRDLRWLSAGWPAVRVRFATHRLYSMADVPAVLGKLSSPAQEVQVNTLASMLFLNRSNHFEAVRLPDEAQWAPAFGVTVADFDGDGAEDLFLSQNFFSMRTEEPRLDAGRGLCLRGDGAGGFRAVPGQESGVKIYGEQRGSAVGDFDEDGRVDLVVTQSGNATRLFRNQGAKPGLRLRLQGPPQNPAGIGAVVRLVFGEKSGPARELHGGSGYWSQDSLVQVLATPQPPTAIWVRWPGGTVTKTLLTAPAREVAVDMTGKLSILR